MRRVLETYRPVRWFQATAVTALAVVFGCDDAELDTTLGGSQAIFSQSCAISNCHSGKRPQAGLSLVRGDARAQLVDVPTTALCEPGEIRLVPGDPEASCLWILVRDDLMPYNRTPLSAEEKDTLLQWVVAGAPE